MPEESSMSKQTESLEKEIIFLEPVFTRNIWGGTRLRDEFHYPAAGEQTGECWGIAAHPNGDCRAAGGALSGWKLSEIWKQHPELFGGLKGERFPLLTKIIDAKDDLSIQVHPDDAYAKVHEHGSMGKTECWYILDCPEHARLVMGHHAGSKAELCEMIQQGRWSELIREIPVKKGDFIQINPGTVHAVKGGFLILETQQNSDVTYRVYDYGRLQDGKPRALHISQSIDVIQVPAEDTENFVKSTDGLEHNRMNLLYACRYYRIFKIEVNGMMKIQQEYPFLNLSVCEGSGRIQGTCIQKGCHMIVPAGFGEIVLEGKMTLTASTVNDREGQNV